MASFGSIIAGSGSGSGITNWDPIAQPNFIQSGVNKSGVFLLINDLTTTLDELDIPVKKSHSIYFDKTTNKWTLCDEDFLRRISLLENQKTYTNKGDWNASTNNPSISIGSGDFTDTYNITGSGEYDFGFGLTTYSYPNLITRLNDGNWLQIARKAEVNDSVISNVSAYSSEKTVQLLDGKVDKDGTKVLSDNNFTDEEKAQYDAYATNKEDADITILKQADVIDNLTSTDTNKPVSANKAKELKDQIDAIISPTQSNVLKKYVSVNAGDNSLNGQVDRKMQTIDFALTSMSAQSSCTVECEDGTYPETLTFGTSRSRRTLKGVGQRTIINRLMTFNENCQQCEIYDFKFENTQGGYAIQVSSTLSNFVFSGFTCGGNHTNPIFLDVASGGSGYIAINNCDLNNKIINLNNSSTLRYCYVNNSVNLIINAGTGWIVIKNNCQNVFESSSNNNILEGNIANGVVSNDTEYNAIVSLGASGNGYYLSNYTKSGVFSIGDVILRINPSTLVDHKHYNASSTYYVITTQKTYCKSGGSWKEITTNNLLDLKADKTNVLELNNTTTFTPTANYQPATKKYVDDASALIKTQSYSITNQSLVSIDHNLNRNPIVQFLNNSGEEEIISIIHDSLNRFTVYSEINVTGKIIYF